MGEEQGLGPLEVGVAGEQSLVFTLGEIEKGTLGGADFGEPVVDLFAGPETKIGRDLIVAAAAGVELLAEVADGLDEFEFNSRVDIFLSRAEGRIGLFFGEVG